MTSTAANRVDFDVNGVVGVGLLDADERDVRTVARQLQRAPGTLSGDPDIVVRFVGPRQPQGLRLLGLNWAGFDNDAFYLLDARSGAVTASIDFAGIGSRCEIACPGGGAEVPLLAEIVSASFCAKGHVAVHGSGFRFADKGVLVAGWEKGGKTEALLAFATHGAQFVGDEAMLLSADGTRMLGVPMPLSVWGWQAAQTGGLVPVPGVGRRTVFAAIGLLERLNRRLRNGRIGGWGPFRALDKAMPTLMRQRRTWHWPDELFDGSDYGADAPVDRVFLMSTHEDASVAVQPCDAARFADSMAASNEHERTHLVQYYRAFRFAFPDRRNAFLDDIEARQSEALRTALAGREVFEVVHPYPVSLEDLFQAMRPFVDGTG